MGRKRGCLVVLVVPMMFVLIVLLGLTAEPDLKHYVPGWKYYQHYQRFAQTPLNASAPNVEITRGDSLHAVLLKLRGAGVQSGTNLEWQLLAYQVGAAGNLKVGEYSLVPAVSPRDLLQRMRQGKGAHYRFTIVEGWNIRQLRAALRQASPLAHVAATLDDATLMAQLGFPGEHPEGRFLPETYLYQRGDSDLDVLRRAHAAMQKALAETWAERDPELGLHTSEEALILASIVEKESALSAERPKIAGVFLHRLARGMRLQADSTVIYGLGSVYDGNIRKRDLRTATPYNTYVHTGLTPTPISMPGRDALRAVTRPALGDALYFVAIGDGSGAHTFSSSLKQHNAAVARYLQRLREGTAKQRQ